MNGRMPPWSADPEVGEFSNFFGLSSDEKRDLVHWLRAGAPRGSGPDPLLSLSFPSDTDWPLGPPDLVVDLPLQEIPASGEIDYRYVTVDVPIDRDVWVRAATVRPSNVEVMHHAFAFAIFPESLRGDQPQWHRGIQSFFSIYAPGTNVDAYPDNSGQFLPAGSKMEFQLHYQSVGHPSEDRPQMALYFHDAPPAREYHVFSASNVDFVIPPHARNYRTGAEYRFKQDAVLYSMMAHMHYRGRRMHFKLHYPDKSSEYLLSVPNYNFNWQTIYHLAEPRKVPAGSRMVVHGAFDNSAGNPLNPDPDKEVSFGLQSWEEMFIGYMMFTTARE
jgi:hypothetical protein